MKINRISLFKILLIFLAGMGLHPSLSAITYSGSALSHPSTTTAYQGDVDLQILQIRIDMVNGGGPKSMQSLSFSTNGSTNPAGDLLNAKVYFTGASNVFATGNQFGPTLAGPNGPFAVTGTQALANGANYFWLVYDVRASATVGNVIDAECLGFNISGTGFTPATTAPAGNRPIDIARTTWQLALGTTGNEFGNDLVQTPDGGYILAGYGYNFGAGSNDAYLVRIDAQGNVIWANSYGNSADEWPESIIRLSDGNYALAGRTSSFGGGDYDLYAMKIDINGNLLWERSYGGSGYEVGWDVAEMHDGSLVFAGQTDGFGSGNLDGYLVHTDANGALLWTRTLGSSLGIDVLYTVMETSDSLILVTGSGRDVSNDTDALVAKFDQAGNLIWATLFGGTGNEVGWDIKEQTDGRFLMSGFTTSFGAGGADVLIARIDPAAGTVLRAQAFGATGTDYGNELELTADGGAAFIGHTNSAGAGGTDYFLTKIDSSGNLEWSWVYGSGSMETPHGMVLNTDATYSIIGETFGFGIPSDIYLVRAGTDGISRCNEVASGFVRNNVSVTQTYPLFSFSGGSDFSNTPLVLAVSTSSSVQCLNIVLDEAALALEGQRVGGKVSLNWQSEEKVELAEIILERSEDGQIFEEVGRPAPRSDQYLDEQAGTGRMWYRLRVTDRNGGQSLSNVAEVGPSPDQELQIWPQPAREVVNIRWETGAPLRWELLSLAGGEISRGTFAGGSGALTLPSLSSGIYLLKLQSGELQVRRKLLVR